MHVENPPEASWPRMTARAAAGCAAAIGLLGLVGWMADVPTLRSVLPGMVEMKANTAICLIAIGVALWLLGPGSSGSRRIVGQALAASVTVVALLTLGEHMFGWDLRIDQLLFPEPTGAVQTSSPGRMAFITAVDFVLLGIALQILDHGRRRGRSPARILALIAGSLALLSLLGYLYGAPSLYGAAPWFTGIAVHTAFGFLLLSVALLLSRTDVGLVAIASQGGPGGRLLQRLGPAAVLVPMVLGWLTLRGQQSDLYSPPLGAALGAMAGIVILGALVCVGAIHLEHNETQRRRAIHALEMSERRYRALAREFPNGTVAIYDQDLRFTLIDGEALAQIGWSQDDYVGKTIWEAFPPDVAAELAPAYRATLLGERAQAETVVNGRTFLFQRTPIHGEGGGIEAGMIVALDITERKRVESELLQAKAEAERGNLAKDQFLSRMSHEVRTPLNAILGFAQLLEMDLAEPGDLQSVRQILTGGRHLLSLIDEVLDISRISTGSIALSLEPVGVAGVLSECLDLIRPLAAERDVSLVAGEMDAVLVMADRQRLQQVMLNLLSNGVKYNHAGGRVDVSLQGAAERLRILVADTGVGIAPELRERLFAAFDRLGAESTGVQGTGLGLALSKGLVEAMGGSLSVEDHSGAGTTFVVELAVAGALADHDRHVGAR